MKLAGCIKHTKTSSVYLVSHVMTPLNLTDIETFLESRLPHEHLCLCLVLQVNGFRSYVDLYVKDKLDETGVALKVVNETVNERWEVCLTMSEKGFQQISFVNSIATTKVSETLLLITEIGDGSGVLNGLNLKVQLLEGCTTK